VLDHALERIVRLPTHPPNSSDWRRPPSPGAFMVVRRPCQPLFWPRAFSRFSCRIWATTCARVTLVDSPHGTPTSCPRPSLTFDFTASRNQRQCPWSSSNQPTQSNLSPSRKYVAFEDFPLFLRSPSVAFEKTQRFFNQRLTISLDYTLNHAPDHSPLCCCVG
jgi:hypothetical protein